MLRAVLIGHLHNLALAVILVFYQIQARGVGVFNVTAPRLAIGWCSKGRKPRRRRDRRGRSRAGPVRRAGAVDVGRDLRLRAGQVGVLRGHGRGAEQGRAAVEGIDRW